MNDKIDALERLGRLKAVGAISEDEFFEQKRILLSGGSDIAERSKTLGEHWKTGIEQSRGIRRFSRWFWGLQLIAIAFIAVYFAGRLYGQNDEPVATDNAGVASATLPSRARPETAPAYSDGLGVVAPDGAFGPDDADFNITDETLNQPQPDWAVIQKSLQNRMFCPHSFLSLTNDTSETLHLEGRPWKSDKKWTIGTVKPDATIVFKVGGIPGIYVVTTLQTNKILIAYEVKPCPGINAPQ